MSSMNIKKETVFRRKWNREDILCIGMRLVLILTAVIYIYPVIFAAFTSLKTLPEFYADIWAWPKQFLYKNYIYLPLIGAEMAKIDF